MNAGEQIATELLSRLLAGERGAIPIQLSMLLERSARIERGDEANKVEADYKHLLPPELIKTNIPAKVAEEIIAQLCAAISCDPDPWLISTLAATGTRPAIKAVVRTLLEPPRALTLDELTVAFSYLSTFVPIYCAESPEFISHGEVAGLAELAKEVSASGGPADDKGERKVAKELAVRLLESLSKLGG
jgi:hypothetical protein